MKIFYELTHTSCDRENMRSPDVQWDIYHPGGWDTTDRPFPENARLVDKYEGPYDAAVVGTEHRLSTLPKDLPVVFVCRTDFGSWPKPTGVVQRVSAWTTACQETVDRWGMKGDPKAVVIDHGIDSEVFRGYVGNRHEVLSVGNLIPSRPEKGPDVLRAVGRAVPVQLYGFGNEGFPYANPCAGMPVLAGLYREFAVYFNPCTVTVCAVLEAMATGMPVVTMGPVGNYKELMRHKENCFIASSVNDAVHYINLLLQNPGLCRDIGIRARQSVEHRFHPAICAYRWRSLLRRVAEKVAK